MVTAILVVVVGKKIRYDFVKKPEVALLLFKKLSTTLNFFFQKYIITSINFCDL